MLIVLFTRYSKNIIHLVLLGHCSSCLPMAFVILYSQSIVYYVFPGHCLSCIPRAMFIRYSQGLVLHVFTGHCSLFIPRALFILYSQGIVQFVFPGHCLLCIRMALFIMYSQGIVYYVFPGHWCFQATVKSIPTFYCVPVNNSSMKNENIYSLYFPPLLFNWKLMTYIQFMLSKSLHNGNKDK